MKGKYAINTTVPVSRTRAELQRVIQERYGATRYGVLEEAESIHIIFTMRAKNIRLDLALPSRCEFTSERAFDQATRSAWRAMLLYVKAKLEACDRDVVDFEKEWLPHFICAGNQTVYELAVAGHLPFSTGPLLLTAGTSDEDVVEADVVE